MSHRGGGGGYTRGSGGFRQKGRATGSPYWKDNQRQHHHGERDHNSSSTSDSVDHLSITPTRDGNHSVTDQSPADSKPVKKFSNKARVFIANLPRDMPESELRALFEAHGEVQEVFLQKEKNFAFCRMAYRSEAERAIAALNGSIVKGRDIKVRFAASNSSVKVDNLHPLVSNERLMEAFSQFGEVEEAVVVTDDRGKSKGYGIVDFARKQGAINAISRCKNAPFLLTKSPIPVAVSEYVRDNEEEGQPDKNISKNQAFMSEYECPPRFPAPGDLEFMVASRWKVAFDEEKAQRDELEMRIKENRAAIREQMNDIHKQHETEMLRQELARHQQQGLRLMQQLSEREGNLMPPASGAGLLPPVVPPLFPVGDHQEASADSGQVTIPGLGGLLPPGGGGFIPQPLMGQPGFEKYH